MSTPARILSAIFKEFSVLAPTVGAKLDAVTASYAVQAPGDEEEEITSAGGLMLSAEGRQIAKSRKDSSRSHQDFVRQILFQLTRQHLDEMRRVLDDYIEKTKESILALKVERECTDADISEHRSQVARLNKSMETMQRAIGRIENGHELETNADGTLADPELEAAIKSFERRNQTQIDRHNASLLLAVLKSENDTLRKKAAELDTKISELVGDLEVIDTTISEKERMLAEAEEFRDQLDDLSRSGDPENKAVRIDELLKNAPPHVLEALRTSDKLSNDARTAVEQVLHAREPSASSDRAEADNFMASLGLDQQPSSNLATDLPELSQKTQKMTP